MAQDIFIKINGIEGESQDAKHKGEIDVLSWGWSVAQQSSSGGSGRGHGKATVGDLAFEHFVDRSSPNLVSYCFSGKHIDQVVLTVRKAGGSPLEFLKITISDVIVTLVQPSGSNSDSGIREQVHLSFSKIKEEYIVQNKDGGNGGAVSTTLDVAANKVI